MKNKIIATCLVNIVLTLPLTAQNEEAEAMLMQGNKMGAVIAVIAVILLGIVLFLLRMEKRIGKMEKTLESEND